MTKLLVFLGFLSVGLMGAILVRPFFKDANPIRITLDKFSRLGWVNKIAILFIVVQLTMFGGAKHGGTNDVDDVAGTNQVEIVGGDGDANEVGGIVLNAPQPMSNGSAFLGGCGPLGTTAPAVAAQTYRLESVSTNEGYSYAIQSEGVVRGTWHLTGAYEDVQKVALDGFAFPLGSGLCSSLWAYTWGKARPQLKNASNEIAAVGAPMSAIPDVSRFWTMATTNDTYLLTWENFAAGRLTTNEVEEIGGGGQWNVTSAQIELMRNGDFITRLNDVESVYHRVNPDDIDDDGIQNEEDDEPVVPADETQFGPHQTLPIGSDTNYYYWVDLVVGPANARVVFEGDGESNWPDPSFIAKAGETNRVYLLIGKTYGVRCPMPIQCVDREDGDVEVYPDGDGLLICWDIRMEFVSERPLLMARPLLGSGSGSGGTGVRIIPGRAGGGSFSWPGSFCCYNFAADGSPVFNCQGNCGCGGYCNTGNIIYTYVGYSRDFDGWSCSCHSPGEDDDPHGGDDDSDDPPTVGYATAWFTKSAIIFEDEYEPSGGVTVPRRSTESTLTCFAYGGPSGGEATFEVEGDSRLVTVSGRTLPFTQRVGPNEDYEIEIVYQGKKGSGDQVQVTASFVSNDPDEHVDDSTANLDVVEIEIMCQIQAPLNTSMHRHKFGVLEEVVLNRSPASANLHWNTSSGRMLRQGLYQCPTFATSDPLTAVCGDARFTPAITVVKPHGIEARNPEPVTYGVQAGRAGWIGLKQEFYATPLDVCFSGIAMQEVPSTVGERFGYFADPAFAVISCHSFAMGAGVWLGVDNNNRMGNHDTASMTMGLQRVDANGNFTENTSCSWRYGWVTWEVPFGWASKEILTANSSAHMIEQFDPNSGSRFVITQSGDVTVRKFANEAKREINGTVTLNGELWSAH